MSIPDYISPIIGWRVWRWDASRLRSLNGKPWSSGQPLAAKCGAGNAHDAHEPPQADCTCGVYAAKSLDHLRQIGLDRYGVLGEVNLWGTVVEHELGWRAQFAYPKSLFLPPDLIPSDTKEMESRLEALAAYSFSSRGRTCRSQPSVSPPRAAAHWIKTPSPNHSRWSVRSFCP